MNTAGYLSIVILTLGCGGTMGETQLTDGNRLHIAGSGAKSTLSVKCLKPDAIQQLTGSQIDPSVPQQSCYTVVFVSADSSSISKAISSYVNADNEFGEMVTQSSVTTAVAVAKGPVGDVVNNVVEDAVSSKKSAAVVAQGAANAAATLDTNGKATVKTQLTDIASKQNDQPTKDVLNAAAAAIQ